VTVSNPFNHTIAVEFYISRNQLKHMHLAEIKAYEYAKELDKARVKAMKQQVDIFDNPINPNSDYAKRYKNVVEEFKSSSKHSALTKLPFMKIYCEREEFKAYLKRKEQDPYTQELGYWEVEMEKKAKEKLYPFIKDMTPEELIELSKKDEREIELFNVHYDSVWGSETNNSLLLCAITAELFTKNPKTQEMNANMWN